MINQYDNPVLVLIAALAKVPLPFKKIYVMGSASIYGNFSMDEIRNDAATLPLTTDIDVLVRPYMEEVANTMEAALGWGSSFFDEHDIHIDAIDEATCILPVDWEERVKSLPNDFGIKVLCVDVYDTCASKMARGEDKDRMYVRVLIDAELISLRTLIKRVGFLDDQQIKHYEGNVGSKHSKQDILNTLRGWL